MRAIVCREWGPPKRLQVETLPERPPGAGEVGIRVRAAGVNFPDALIVMGKYQMQPAFPFVPGAEIAGTITALGEDVKGFAVGDDVLAYCGVGGFAEHATVPAKVVMPLPRGFDFEVAASFTLAWGTAWHALRDRATLAAGETLLVLGAAGGVGLAAIQIGKALGARVIAAASTESKLEVCRQHGADEVINYETTNLREALRASTGGKGVDVVFDPVGGAWAEPAFRALAWRGRYLVIGFASGTIPALPWNLALLKGASVVGVFWGDFTQREPARFQAGLGEMLQLIRAGKLRPGVSRRYTLEQVPEALADLLERRATGKLVVIP